MNKRAWLSILWVIAMFIGLAGCTPEYNWREINVAEDRAVIAFPARVQTEQRSLPMDGMDLKFSLTTSNVGQSVFAVGFIKLPPDFPSAALDKLTRGLIDSLMSRSNQPPGSDLIDKASKGEVFELDMTVGQQPAWLMGRVLVHQGMLLQVVVSGPKKGLTAENAKEFMRSLVLK